MDKNNVRLFETSGLNQNIVYLCAKIITDGKILQHRWTADF